MRAIKDDSHIDRSGQSEISLHVNPITTRPTFKAFWTSEGPKCPKMGSKWAHFTRLCTPNGLG